VRTLWVDAGNGAAGDMLLAALLDAGADLAAVRAGLHGIGTEPLDVTVSPVRRHGLRAAHATVHAPPSTVPRHLADIIALLTGAGLPDEVRDFAAAVFERLARAEARVHGVDASAVGFHEVGALDAIADVVGCALALNTLGLLGSPTRVVSPVAVGSGSARTAHGILPVPAPATLELLAEAAAPLRAHAAPMELCTPTGAALLATLATSWGPPPDCVPRAVGVGAGRADPHGHPNVLRVLVGDAASAPGWAQADMCRIDATIDDLDPRLWPDVLEALRGAGAADAWCTPALMRKGRPGQVLSALAEPDRLDVVCRVVFEETTTLGVRISSVQRRSLSRDEVSVPVAGEVISVKRGRLGDRVVTVQPEYDDVRAAAARTGRPVADLLAEARAAATARDDPRGLRVRCDCARGGWRGGQMLHAGLNCPGLPGAMGCDVDQVAEDVVAGQRGVAWLVKAAVDGDRGLQAMDAGGQRRAGELQGDRAACHGGAIGRGEGMALAVGQRAGGDFGREVHVSGSKARADPERQAHRRRLAGDPEGAARAFLGREWPLGVDGRRGGRAGRARGRLGRGGAERGLAPDHGDEAVVVPAGPAVLGVGLEVAGLRAPHGAVGVDEQLDVERGVRLLALGLGESAACQLPRLAGPVLADDLRGGHAGQCGEPLRGVGRQLPVGGDARVGETRGEGGADPGDLLHVVGRRPRRVGRGVAGVAHGNLPGAAGPGPAGRGARPPAGEVVSSSRRRSR